TLFTGDTVYPAALYAHYNSADFGHSRLDIYSKTIQALVPLVPQLDHLCCSHNLALVDPSILIRIRDGFNAIQNNQALGKVDAEGLTRYDFADFAIITN
ncbi:MAG: hypothetical protein RR051_07955, partial [Clostridiales bacterium]